jgi:arabinosaccharide transport system substrate-binding protein
MFNDFPYGKAALWILITAVIGLAAVFFTHNRKRDFKPDLTMAVHTDIHYKAYMQLIPEFEKQRNVKISLQLVSPRALQRRLQSALLAGADVPDIVEIVWPAMGLFTRGPIDEIGFMDLTDRLKEAGYYDRIVKSRFTLWSSRGRIFAMPHDVHPVMLVYRTDIIESLGIDVNELDTWEKFCEVGRRVTKDIDGDGLIDRYMLQLDSEGRDFLLMMAMQRGAEVFDKNGNVAMDSQIFADTVYWYIMQCRGPGGISFDPDTGQTLYKSILDGLVLFYPTADHNTKMYEMDLPSLAGKMKIMPLPAWEKGGRRSTTVGGTGLAITKACKKKDLAWDFAEFLYYKNPTLSFEYINVIPPLVDSWDDPIFEESNSYYSGQRIGQIFIKAAKQTPDNYVTAYTFVAMEKLTEAYLDCALYYDRNGKDGLKDYIRERLIEAADYVRNLMERNRFLNNEYESQAGKEKNDSQANQSGKVNGNYIKE